MSVMRCLVKLCIDTELLLFLDKDHRQCILLVTAELANDIITELANSLNGKDLNVLRAQYLLQLFTISTYYPLQCTSKKEYQSNTSKSTPRSSSASPIGSYLLRIPRLISLMLLLIGLRLNRPIRGNTRFSASLIVFHLAAASFAV